MKVVRSKGTRGLWKWVSLTLLLVFLVVMTGCSAKSVSNQESASERSPGSVSSEKMLAGSADSSSRQEAAVPQEAVPRKVSNQWKFSIEVQDSRKANSDIITRVDQLKGYVAQSSLKTVDDKIQANLSVKVPAVQSQPMVDFLNQLGKIAEQSRTSTDVSDTYYDTEARLKVMLKEEERLLSLLETRTAGIQDLLAVEREIARVRGEREALQARMNQLNNQVDYTTFTITLEENKTALETPKGTWGKAGQGFVTSLNQLVRLLNGAIILLITLAPYLLLLFVIIYLVKRFWWNRRKIRRAALKKQGDIIVNATVETPPEKQNE